MCIHRPWRRTGSRHEASGQGFPGTQSSLGVCTPRDLGDPSSLERGMAGTLKVWGPGWGPCCPVRRPVSIQELLAVETWAAKAM